jgi:hypothetical protein
MGEPKQLKSDEWDFGDDDLIMTAVKRYRQDRGNEEGVVNEFFACLARRSYINAAYRGSCQTFAADKNRLNAMPVDLSRLSLIEQLIDPIQKSLLQSFRISLKRT